MWFCLFSGQETHKNVKIQLSDCYYTVSGVKFFFIFSCLSLSGHFWVPFYISWNVFLNCTFSYLEKQAFLQRTDERQFDIERDMRKGTRGK